MPQTDFENSSNPPLVKTAFVTGVAGFLGSHLADALISRGYKVVGIDNLIGGYKDNIPAGVEFYEIDCNNLPEVTKVMEGSQLVVHSACTAYEGLSVFSPKLVSQNTFGATVSVLTAAICNDVKRFVQLSSMARYGSQETHPFTEDMEPKPQDPYGIAKFAAELMIRELCETHDMEYVIAVPHNIIGPRQKYDDPFRNVASIMINLMLSGKQPFIYGDGTQERCFSYIEDVIDPLVKICELPGISGEVFNIGPDEGTTTINDLAILIAELLDFPLNPQYVPGRPREVKFATCSAGKAREILSYDTTFNLRDGLINMIEAIKERGTRPFDYHLPLEINSPMLPITWKNKLF
jgi:UDP-glucose 4-epimerase